MFNFKTNFYMRWKNILPNFDECHLRKIKANFHGNKTSSFDLRARSLKPAICFIKRHEGRVVESTIKLLVEIHERQKRFIFACEKPQMV